MVVPILYAPAVTIHLLLETPNATHSIGGTVDIPFAADRAVPDGGSIGRMPNRWGAKLEFGWPDFGTFRP